MIGPPLVTACRPRQWPKNLLVYASAIFSFRTDPLIWINSSIALVSFCLISSSIYLINDVLDVEADRAHPSKCRRPIASGALSIKEKRTGTQFAGEFCYRRGQRNCPQVTGAG